MSSIFLEAIYLFSIKIDTTLELRFEVYLAETSFRIWWFKMVAFHTREMMLSGSTYDGSVSNQ